MYIVSENKILGTCPDDCTIERVGVISEYKEFTAYEYLISNKDGSFSINVADVEIMNLEYNGKDSLEDEIVKNGFDNLCVNRKTMEVLIIKK